MKGFDFVYPKEETYRSIVSVMQYLRDNSTSIRLTLSDGETREVDVETALEAYAILLEELRIRWRLPNKFDMFWY